MEKYREELNGDFRKESLGEFHENSHKNLKKFPKEYLKILGENPLISPEGIPGDIPGLKLRNKAHKGFLKGVFVEFWSFFFKGRDFYINSGENSLRSTGEIPGDISGSNLWNKIREDSLEEFRKAYLKDSLQGFRKNSRVLGINFWKHTGRILLSFS